METELKLRIAQADLDRVAADPLIADHASGAPDELDLVDTYYDTPDLTLWRHGLTLRVREQANNWIQTVKTAAGGSPALHERGEWENVLTSSQPRPAELARQIKSDKIARLLQARGTADALQPIFTNASHRTLWHLTLPSGQRVECALDHGEINCGDRKVAVQELEFEIRKGNPTQLFELALALHEKVPLELANDSKAARGYALLQRQGPVPVMASATRLARKIRMEDAFHAMGLNCLGQIEANAPGVLARSAENLHQMRVGVRRLRALLDLFDALAPLPSQIGDGLRWLADALGTTRDWDVLAGTTLTKVLVSGDDTIQKLAAQKARDYHETLVTSLHHPRYTELILQLNGWFHGRQWARLANAQQKAKLSARASDEMISLLQRAQHRLVKRARAADPANPGTLHRVRIAAKKARYAAEFFADLLPRGRGRRYISTVSQLQDQLGAVNDLVVASKILLELESDAAPAALGYTLGYASALTASSRPAVNKALRRTHRLKLPCKK